MGTYSLLHNETYRRITQQFPNLTLRENIRPDWLRSSNLTKLEIDIYIEELNTAIEIQGRQHYEYVPQFHKTYHDFEEQLRRDNEKRELCAGNGVRLVEIACAIDLSNFLDELKNELAPVDYEYATPGNYILKSKRARKAIRREAALSTLNKWSYNKWLRDHKVKGSPRPKIKFPGTSRQRKYIRKYLQSEQIDDDSWRIWGGRSEHIVKRSNGNLACDCVCSIEENKSCVHIIKVGWDYGLPIPGFECEA